MGLVLKNGSFLILIVTLYLINFGNSQSVFHNPIFDKRAPDPQILHLGEYYYLVLSIDARDMVVYRSSILTDFRNTDSNLIFHPNSTFDACWAPELHVINGEIYCYFSMHKEGEVDHRMWVTKAVNSANIMGPWTEPIQLMPDEAADANDGTIYKHPVTGQMYFVFTRRIEGVLDPSLYIAPMSDPLTVDHPRVLLKSPRPGEWDCMDACIDEGAHFLYSSNNISHLIFSGSGFAGRNYALGRMSILPGLDPLIPSNWGPVTGRIFAESEEESVYGPGHAAFTTSPDGTEIWMAYHAYNSSDTNANGKYREAYLDKITWDGEGYPVFPKPTGYRSSQVVPSGQQ